VIVGAPLTLAAAQSGPKSRAGNAPLHLLEASNGFGALLPHRTTVPDAQGQPTAQIVEIRSFEDLLNLRPANPILPPPIWPTQTVLPSNFPGNHFVLVRFDQPLDVNSILTDLASAAGQANLNGAIRVERVDPSSGARRSLRGRAFVGGRTYGSPDPSHPGHLVLETWVVASGPDSLQVVDPRGLGFPGAGFSGFAHAGLLADAASFVFVPDADDELNTFEPFPGGGQIQVRITRKVSSRSGAMLEAEGLASSTVGTDVTPPEVVVARGGVLGIVPASGSQDVDPRTDVRIQFTEPIQLLTVGELDDGTPPLLSPSVEIRFGPAATPVRVPFTVRPQSPFDLSLLVLDTAYDLPGSGAASCTDFGAIEVRVHAGQLADLNANLDHVARASGFRTAPGPGLVNAPVTPDAIYVARAGAHAGISVVDLNGFGAGTGNPAFDPAHPIVEGNSNYPNNPNVAIQGALLLPPLAPGTCPVDGGSAGVFTLAKDSNLGDVLAGPPILSSVGDMALGHALDNVFNNGAPFGCQAGGGNLCASTGLKFIELIPGGPNTAAPRNAAPTIPPFKTLFGNENLASFAPHPNPPPLRFPPLCLSPLILGEEPTALDSTRAPPAGPGLRNLLVPGPFPLGVPAIGLPPQSMLSPEQNAFFEGASAPQPTIQACSRYSIRQQVGQFLYAIDRAAGEVVVLNSNRFLVLDRIALPDPTSLAMSPNLDLLAVTSEATDQVFFVDIDPFSATFHHVVRTTAVSDGPRGIAWESGNEDIFVCCPSAGSVCVISAFHLNLRKVLTNQLVHPIDVALTPRQTLFGFNRVVYFGYVLDADGTVAVYESGPDGINGIGFDDIVGVLPFHFTRPKAIQTDVANLNSGCLVLHEEPLDANGNPTGQAGGALTSIGITGGTIGVIPIQPGELPHIRFLEFGVLASLGEGLSGLSGIPVDLAFDDQRNLAALTNYFTTFSSGQPLSANGKSLVKSYNGFPLAASAPQFVFLAVPNPGVIDVLELASGSMDRVDTNAFHAGVQSIPAPGVVGLMNYFRQ
jgi:hypothetical protein